MKLCWHRWEQIGHRMWACAKCNGVKTDTTPILPFIFIGGTAVLIVLGVLANG